MSRRVALVSGHFAPSNLVGAQRARLWQKAVAVWPDYEEYAKRTTREIPVVVLERI